MSRPRSRPLVIGGLLFVAFVLASSLPGSASDHDDEGSGKVKAKNFAEIVAEDATIGTLTASPSSEDPGPVLLDDSDGLAFSSRWTNVRHIVYLDVSSATNDDSESTVTVQGTAHQVADWVFIRQGDGTMFTTPVAVGVYDPDAASYIVPGSFQKDSQGTVTLVKYDPSSPIDGGTSYTLFWVYDANKNRFFVDDADKDFTNGNGEEKVFPVTNLKKSKYVYDTGQAQYGISAVAGAGSDYVPTFSLGWTNGPGKKSGGQDYGAFVLMDLPSGAPSDVYQLTIRATIHAAK